MTKHTPGPWQLARAPQISRRVMMPDDTVEIRAGSGNGGLIACLYARNWPHGMDEGNARLIAAAPDLLEALEAILQSRAIAADASKGPSTRALEKQACAAIAKATA